MEAIIFDKSRVVSFSDAVFSIAMTLLVLEISVPALSSYGKYTILELLASRIPSFIGLFVSFIVTALYWVEHMRVMKFVNTIDSKLLWLNIFLLLFIVLMPFSTGFYVKGIDHAGSFVFYAFNLAAIGFMNYLMVRYVIKKEALKSKFSVVAIKLEKSRAFIAFLVWFLAGVIAFKFLGFARFLFLLIFVLQPISKWYYKRKLMPKTEEEV